MLGLQRAETSFATTCYTINSINAHGIDVLPISDGFDEGGFKQAPCLEAYLESFRIIGSKTLTELIHSLEASTLPINCLVYDSLLPWGLEVAKSLGILSVVFLTNSVSVCSIYRQIDLGLLPLPVKPENMPVLLPGLPPLGREDMPSFLMEPPNIYLTAIMEMFASLDQNNFVLANTFEKLEDEVAKAMSGLWSVWMVGPIIPSAYLDEQIKTDTEYGGSLWESRGSICTKWLNSMPPESVVYVLFGSMARISANQCQPSRRSGQPGRGVLLDTLWVELNSLEALSLGVPVVAVPQWSDQPMNAKFIEEVWKVGVRAKKDGGGIVRKEEVKRCVGEGWWGKKAKSLGRTL
ncbi:UNVERIFIED_CONTAM: UDP-glycosyltransferase 74B1 [Sesamum radiatum]|uniref:UDP-glycosyltransferase 74B1 n=1 Tax=Sesamum radiatum TaxID=300843 RepID=A0AAW2PLN8_SESRA